jgi:hypothetical protein
MGWRGCENLSYEQLKAKATSRVTRANSKRIRDFLSARFVVTTDFATLADDIPEKIVFITDDGKFRFNAVSLLKSIFESRNAINPYTRTPLTGEELQRLEAVFRNRPESVPTITYKLRLKQLQYNGVFPSLHMILHDMRKEAIEKKAIYDTLRLLHELFFTPWKTHSERKWTEFKQNSLVPGMKASLQCFCFHEDRNRFASLIMAKLLNFGMEYGWNPEVLWFWNQIPSIWDQIRKRDASYARLAESLLRASNPALLLL